MATKSAKKRARLEKSLDAQEKRQELYTLAELKGVEILATGKHRDRDFTVSDLEEIAANTNRLIGEGRHNPPGKLGHDDNQLFAKASGLPATGWVDKLRVTGNKLVADFVDVPKMLMDAFDGKLFRKISSEIYFDFVDQDGEQIGKLLRAVAFLGADIPQVKGLADFLQEDGLTPLTLADDFESMGDVSINIVMPPDANEPPAVEIVAPSPEPDPGAPLTSEGLEGFDLEQYRQAEKIVDLISGDAIPEFEKDRSVDALARYAGRVGAGVIQSSSEIRAALEDPEAFTAWLMMQASERGYVDAANLEEKNEVKLMEAQKLQEEKEASDKRADDAEKRATAAEAKAAEATAKLAEIETEKAKGKIAAFIEANKTVITPAVEPSFKALCENASAEVITVKLDDKEQSLSGLDLALKFAGDIIAAKVVTLGELTKTNGKDVKEAEGVKGANFRNELHVAAVAYQEANEGVDYNAACDAVLKESPELATGE